MGAICICSPVIWWARLCSIWLSWVWGCGPASQAVNGGVSVACSGALEQRKSLWAKPKGWAREGPAPHSPSSAGLHCFSALLRVQTGKIWFWKGGRILALHELRWDYQAPLNSPWDQSGGKCQLPRGGARITMEFSSGFHSMSVGVEFIYEMMQRIDTQFLLAQCKKGQFIQNIWKQKIFLLTLGATYP